MSAIRMRIAGVALGGSVAVAAVACLPPPAADTGSAGPSPSAGPTTEASSRPSPTPKPYAQAIEAFVEQATSGTLTYHIAFKGSARASVDILPIVGTMDVAGADFASSFTYDFSDYVGLGKERVQIRAVKGKGYIKRGSGAWRAVEGYSIGNSNVPFKGVETVDDVRYIGEIEAGDATLHKVAITGPVLLHPNTIPYDVQKETIDDTELTVVIDETGRPRSGTWTLRGKARVGAGSGQLQRVEYDLDLTFSKVGSKITIKRP
jgi:hypothetical protein